ncbi:DHA2 family lincomycin resistance protein-like MFS transporter [Cricetibacter osteomyelitidis]|uniref:DHA2 family lincomycin resistance protein-like MFS transporter n=1 Tax=Cricetibacter osteomyelitidis TaxID=1521931 RepID=A0A4R2T2Y4_9PAST|nr:MFS transporter [Cricetibacter osteomyelitidis]TCP97307.1 DHA2 family lincomycin resistance protein-like MFS transporter [Cricetibacter osteomyelitidis]
MNQPHYFSQQSDFPTKTVVAALFITAFLGYLNETLLNVALSTLMTEFTVSKQDIQWLATGFLLVMGAFSPLTAAVLQWFKTKTMTLLTLGIFLLGSLICAAAVNFPMLLGGRLIQALAAALSMPLLINAILVIFPPQQRGRAMSLVAVIFTVAPAIGPTLSGVIVDQLGWRYLFLATVPLVLAAMLMIVLTLKHNLMEITRPPIDSLSALLSILGFGGLVYAASQFAELPPVVFATLLAISIGLIALFVRRQYRLKTPLLDLSVLGVKQFRYAIIILFIAYFLFLGLELLLPMYSQQVLLLSATITGLVLLPASIAEAAFAPIFGVILDKKGGRPILLLGAAIMAGSMAGLWWLIGAETSPYWLAAVFALFAVSVSAAVTGETHGLNHLSTTQNPHGTAIIGMLMPIAGALGVAFFIGITQLGEQLSAADPQSAMLNGFKLAVGLGAILTLTAFFSAMKIHTEYKLDKPHNHH